MKTGPRGSEVGLSIKLRFGGHPRACPLPVNRHTLLNTMHCSKNCKVYVEEKEILKIVTLEKISFAEARKEFKRRQSQTPKNNISYSKAVSIPVKSSQCSSCSVLEVMVKALTEQVVALVKQLSSSSAPLASTPSIPVAPSKSASTYAVIATASTKPKETD
ncbi:hypothetical protein J6590_062034 [Homalodisca vitripennis]|nr:hypothetical protein J6590_062034 [Homalodisca vitripennis]